MYPYDFQLKPKAVNDPKRWLQDYLEVYACKAANDWLDERDRDRAILESMYGYEPQTNKFLVRYEIKLRVSGKPGCGIYPKGAKTRINSYGWLDLKRGSSYCERRSNSKSDLVIPSRRISGSGYGQFPLHSKSHLTCRRACLDDSKCLSWDVGPTSSPNRVCTLHETYKETASGPGYSGFE